MVDKYADVAALPYALERLQSRTRIDEVNSCHIWTGPILHGGHGVISFEQIHLYVHRLGYVLLVGSVPDGMAVRPCPLNRACWHADHLSLMGKRGQPKTRSTRRPAAVG